MSKKIEQFKAGYETFGGSSSTAYLDTELADNLYAGTDKYTDKPVTVRWFQEGVAYREVIIEEVEQPVIEGKILTPEEEIEVERFAEMLEKPASVYVCPECKKEIPRGLENLMKHKKSGGDCDLASRMIEPADVEYEEALLTKANMPEISKRSGKSMAELNVMRKTLLGMNHGMRIKYKVAKTDGGS